MTSVISLFSTPSTQALAWALVHFVWQGALLAGVAAIAMRWVATSPRGRYGIGVITLAVMCAAPIATFLLQTALPVGESAVGQTGSIAAFVDPDPDTDVAASPTAPPQSSRVLPAVVLLWLCGVMTLSARLLGGWAVARRLAARTTGPGAADLQSTVTRIAERLGLRQIVRVAESPAIAVPIVIGWLKPVVLVPTAAVAGLPPAHLEALLAHELAHVRRHDYLVNLLQSAVETLLFYHPAVWWISSRVRQEREHCCDDEAVTICDRMVYVHALADLAAMTVQPRLALAATDGSLLRRIQRLLADRADERPVSAWLSASVAIVLAAALAPAALAVVDDGQGARPAAAAIVAASPVATPEAGAVAEMPASSSSSPTGPVAARRAEPDQDQDARELRERAIQAEREARAHALRQQMSELEVELQRLNERRAQIEERRITDELQLQREAAMERLVAVRKELEATVTRHEVGLAPPQVVDEARAAVEEAEREVRRVQVQLEAERMRREVEAQRAQLEERLARARAENARRDRDGTGEVPGRQEENGTSVARAASVAVPVTDPAAQIRSGDALVIEIAGEDQLPRRYTVEPAGTIRLPLIGRVDAAGRTARQVRDAIARALADRRLAEGRAVTVVIHRAR